jgi:hypothetical protein
MKDIINTILLMTKGSTGSAWSYIKVPLYIIITLAVLYGVVYLAAGRERPDHSDELLLQKIDSLQKAAQQLQQIQTVALGNDVVLYKNIDRLQTQIDSVRGVKSIINNYYGAKSNAVKTLQGKQLDSFFRQRYGY